MKTNFTVLLVLVLLSGLFVQNGNAQQYQVIPVTGFNQDLIAEGVGTGSNHQANATTTITFDSLNFSGASHVMYAMNFRGDKNPSTAPPYGLPNTGFITSVNNTNIRYQLANYTGSNALRLAGRNSTGTLTFVTPGCYSALSILASSGQGSSTFNVTLNFTDGTSNSTYTFTVADWYNGTPYAIIGIGRVNKTPDGSGDTYDTFDGDATNPRLYDCTLTIATGDLGKLLKSITITKNESGTGKTVILGVSGQINSSSPGTPTATAGTNVLTTSFTANWTGVDNCTSYKLDVSTNSNFTTFVTGYNNLDVGYVTSKSVTGLTAGTQYFYRVRAANANGQSFSSNTISVGGLAAPVATDATNKTTTSFSANWGSVSGATGYYLDVASDYYFQSLISGYNNLSVSNVTTYSVTGLTSGITYYYRVRAVSASFTSLSSNIVSTGLPVPPVITYATNITSSSFTANWAAVTATTYKIDVSTSSAFSSFVGSYDNFDVGNVINYSVTGLSANTTYYYRVRSVNATGSSENSNVVTVVTQAAANKVNVVASVGTASANYSTLKLAFDAINAGTHKGTIVITVFGSTTETAAAVLNASGSGSASYTSVNLYPTVSGLSISGSLTTPIIDLSGADNVTIDGRVSATGSTKNLVITNTNTSSSGTNSTIRFISSAQYNTVKYCVIKGSTQNTSAGVVFFSTSASGTGNSFNSINNCDITGDPAGRPFNTVYSLGASGYVNSGDTLRNNNIYNFLNAGLSSTGIMIGNYSSDWTISGNSFYETTVLSPTAGNEYDFIKASNTSGNNFVITGNYIGGQSSQCGGSAMTISGAYTHYIQCIELNVGTTTASSIQNNTIQNITYTSTHTTMPFIGIYITGGNVNIGTSSGNTIGATTGNGSITVTNTTANTTSYGIYISSTGTVEASYNAIGSITVIGSASISHSFYAIYKSSTGGTTTFRYDTIGSSSTSNSIQASSSSASSTAQNVYGIYSSGSSTVTISGNTIANLYNAYAYLSATAGQVAGIVTTGGTNTINGNSIHNISTTSPSTNCFTTAAVIGILQTSTVSGQTIQGDTIYNISSTYSGSNLISVFGLYYNGGTSGTNDVSKNFLHDFSLSSSNISSQIQGLLIISGTTTYSNNIISLGKNISAGYTIEGIYEGSASGNNTNMYFNTVYIEGNPSGGQNTAALKNGNLVANTRIYKNNIFFNARSNSSGSAKHYAMSLLSTGGTLTCDYNDYFANGTGGVLGYYSSTDKSSLPIVSSQDVNSLKTNPLFPSAKANGTLPGDYKPGASLPGVTGTGITVDFTGYTRPSTPTLGIYESNNPLPVSLQSFNSNVNNRNLKLNWITNSEINNIGFEIERIKISESGYWKSVGFIKGMGTKETPTKYTFEDKNLTSGKYIYRLKQIDNNGNFEYYNLNSDVEIGLPTKYELSQNYPNPFNPATRIDFAIPFDSKVKLTVYDISGKEMITLVNDSRTAGYYTVQFDASHFSSGTYFYRLSANVNGTENVTSKKMTLIK